MTTTTRTTRPTRRYTTQAGAALAAINAGTDALGYRLYDVTVDGVKVGRIRKVGARSFEWTAAGQAHQYLTDGGLTERFLYDVACSLAGRTL